MTIEKIRPASGPFVVHVAEDVELFELEPHEHKKISKKDKRDTNLIDFTVSP
jgi:hypothetical protein